MSFSPEFIEAMTKEVFADDDGAGLHDAIIEATSEVSPLTNVSGLTIDDLKLFFKKLPSELQILALQWGLSDTQFRDDVYTCLKKGKI